MRALLCSSIRVISRSRMGMFFSSAVQLRVPRQVPVIHGEMLMVVEEWQSRAWNLSITGPSVACIKEPHALITSGPEKFQSKWQSKRIPGRQLCISALFHGWLVAAAAKVKYFFINTLVRIDVSQGINPTLAEALANLVRVHFIPLKKSLKLSLVLGTLEFFFCFSFTHFVVEIDLLEFLVELGEMVRIMQRVPR